VQSVEIVAQRPLVEKSATNAVRIQSSDEIENLPVRGIQGYFALQPGIVVQNGTTYVRGSRSDEVGYTVEGVNVKDIVNQTGRINSSGYLVTTIPEALEEISVQSGGFGAQFGGANAGIIGQTFKTGGSSMKVTCRQKPIILELSGKNSWIHIHTAILIISLHLGCFIYR